MKEGAVEVVEVVVLILSLGRRCTLALGVFDQILVSTRMIDGGRRQSDDKVRATRTYLIWNNIEPAYTLITVDLQLTVGLQARRLAKSTGDVN